MSEQHPTAGPSITVSSVLTPQATAIAGFVIAVLSLLGQNTASTVLQWLFWGTSFTQSSVPNVMVVYAVGTLLLAVVGGLLALHTLRSPEPAEPWAGHLARAALLVAALGALVSVVGIIGGLVH